MGESINIYMARMQQIDEIARKTIREQEKRIPEKYANIEATLKLLTNLITTFKKKADTYELELRGRAKIDDLAEQISFHRARVEDCQRLSLKLAETIQEKRKNIAAEQARAEALRRQIIQSKTENVKKIMKLEELQRIQIREQEKEKTLSRKITWKMKTEYNRDFHTIGQQDREDTELQLLQSEKQRLASSLHDQLDARLKLSRTIEESFVFMKAKLHSKERKANINGLNGSLMFRIIENEKPCAPKSLFDSKLIIYDVLKERHKSYLKNERFLKDSPVITQEEFMDYNPLQVLGIIELKGGLGKLLENIATYEKTNNVSLIERKDPSKSSK